MDDKWIQETAARVKQDIETKKAKDAKAVEKQKLKKELGPGVWNELRDWLKDACRDLNAAVGTEVVQYTLVNENEVSLSGKADGMHRTMIVKFDGATVEYSSRSGDPSRKFEIAINSDGSAGLGERGLPFGRKPADVGKEIMKNALEVVSY